MRTHPTHFSPSAILPGRRRRRSLGALLLAVSLLAGWGIFSARVSAAPVGFSPTGPLAGLGSGKIWSLAVEPSMPATIIAGTDAGVYVSHDTGATWTQTLAGIRVWTVGFDAHNASEAFAGTNGRGVYASADSGATWADSSNGLGNLDVRALAFGLDGIAAGTNAGVALSPNGHVWHDGGLDRYAISAVAVAANYPQFTVIAGADGALGGTLASGYLFSSSGGGAWEVLQSGLPAGAVVSSISAGQIDAAVPKRPLIVATSQGIFRSGDGGMTWTAGTGAPTALTLTTVQFGPLDPNLAYAGADAGGSTGGDLYRSTDGGLTYHKADTGLPAASRNVDAIAIANTTPPEVVVALNPPAGGSQVYLESDTTAPAPPPLVAESPGAPVPSSVPTPVPTATPVPQAVKPATTSPPASGIQRFAQAAFHWPTPLVYEIFFVLLALYVYVRWRQRYYVEGPP
ncbi:MAG: hypothetical protein ACYDCS_11705 [Candidatus Dormibacteria bacterium]